MLTGYELGALDVLNVCASGFIIVFLALAILYGFVNLLSWSINKLQKNA